MQELLQEAVAPVNIVFTIFLVFVLMYWVTVFIGILDIGSFDFDIDVDADVGVDVDVDTDVDAGHGAGWMAGALHFFNLGRLPFMVILTFLVLFMWAISMWTNFNLGHGSWTFALAMFIPNLFVSLIATKIITSPLVPIFDKLDGTVDPVDYIGMICTMILPASSTQVGQAEVMVDDTPLLINVKVEEGNLTPILKGERALITREVEDGRYYIIERFDKEY